MTDTPQSQPTWPLHRWPETRALPLALIALTVFTMLKFPVLTTGLTAVCALIFVATYWAAVQLVGRRSTACFAGLAVAIGWFAEQTGSSYGWFFGRYTYTEVLGVQLGNVPVVIPLLWFALSFIGYVMASLLLWQRPVYASPSLGGGLLCAWAAAMIVTAFDLGADPYLVFVLEAWVMNKTDGGWFGETLQGFVGWMVIASAILMTYQWTAAPREAVQPTSASRRAIGVCLAIYGSGLVFQVLFGHPIEIRAVAFFAMGLPLLVAVFAFLQWQAPAKEVAK